MKRPLLYTTVLILFFSASIFSTNNDNSYWAKSIGHNVNVRDFDESFKEWTVPISKAQSYTNFKVISQLTKGEFFQVSDVKGNWVYIKGKSSGWVAKQYIQKLDPQPLESFWNFEDIDWNDYENAYRWMSIPDNYDFEKFYKNAKFYLKDYILFIKWKSDVPNTILFFDTNGNLKKSVEMNGIKKRYVKSKTYDVNYGDESHPRIVSTKSVTYWMRSRKMEYVANSKFTIISDYHWTNGIIIQKHNDKPTTNKYHYPDHKTIHYLYNKDGKLIYQQSIVGPSYVLAYGEKTGFFIITYIPQNDFWREYMSENESLDNFSKKIIVFPNGKTIELPSYITHDSPYIYEDESAIFFHCSDTWYLYDLKTDIIGKKPKVYSLDKNIEYEIEYKFLSEGRIELTYKNQKQVFTAETLPEDLRFW